MSSDQESNASPAGQIIRSADEIARVLKLIIARQIPITASLLGGQIQFQSQLRGLDSSGRFIAVGRSSSEEANAALLARPRCAFVAASSDWHVEFVAAEPKEVTHGQARLIRLNFPEILVYLQRRERARALVSPKVPLRCVADAGGVMSFDGLIVDIGPGGVGSLVYAPNITLEPGTVLKGCRIEIEGMGTVTVDVEIRYSELVPLADGRHALRSGCKFIRPPAELIQFVEKFIADHLTKPQQP